MDVHSGPTPRGSVPASETVARAPNNANVETCCILARSIDAEKKGWAQRGVKGYGELSWRLEAIGHGDVFRVIRGGSINY